MAARFDKSRVAQALAEADNEKVEAVAERYGVSPGTVSNWRCRLRVDDELREKYERYARLREEVFIQHQKQAFSKNLSTAFLEGIELMRQCFRELDPADPETARQVNEFLTNALQLFAVSEKIRNQPSPRLVEE